MWHALVIVVLVLLFSVLVAVELLKNQKILTAELEAQKKINRELRYQLDYMQEMESLKNEAREKAKELGKIKYDDVDTAISILHDNPKD